MDTLLSINLIATNPEIRSGRSVVAGTGVCLGYCDGDAISSA